LVSSLLLLVLGICEGRVSRTMLSPTGPEVSRIAWGTLHLAELADADLVLERIHACLDVGITTVDLSDAYPPIPTYGPPGYANELFGEALQKEPGLRSQLELIAKMGIHMNPIVPYTDTSREHILDVIDEYLNALNTTYLDVVLFHMPDYLIDPIEIAQLFTELRESGTVLHLGVSNFHPYLFDLLQSYCDFPLVTNQIEISVYNPLAVTNGQIDHLHKLKLSPLAWGPLGGHPLGANNRLYDPVVDTPRLQRIRRMLDITGFRLGGFSDDQVAIAWLLRHPANVIPILGTMNVTRIRLQSDTEIIAANMSRSLWWNVLWVASEENPWPLRGASMINPDDVMKIYEKDL